MSDTEEVPEEKPFAVEVAKQGRAVCKKCKQKCLQGEVRLAKLVYNPFASGKMKAWHHVNCLFELFLKQRASTKRIQGPDDIEGWDGIEQDDQDEILNKIKDCNAFFGTKTPSKSPKKPKTLSPPKHDKNDSKVEHKKEPKSDTESTSSKASSSSEKAVKDNLFKQFRRLVADVANDASYLDKTECVKKVFTEGSDGKGFKGNVALWCKMLLPGVVKRVYNLQSKQLIKLFSKIFFTNQDDMLEDLEQGDVGETIQKFFEQSIKVQPAKNSLLTMTEVDQFLSKLSKLTKEDEQTDHFKSFIPKCTSNDLKIVIRLIKGDLRMGAGAKHILEGVHPDAYEAYQASRNLDAVIEKCLDGSNAGKNNKTVKAEISLMTPVLPMLAEACKSVEQAMKKCPNGMYSEIKYDGERVQVHKRGSDFKYFSRALKPVMPHKIQHFKEFIPKAFPHAKDLILDSEILMIDTETGAPLPFGTLGKHKKAEFKDANVCLFVFDCIYYNGESLIQKPMSYRKKVLQENMKEIPNRVMFSEMEEIHKKKDLARMIAKVLKQGLEGLVLKDLKSIYEPGKRHWLKVKKDYLFEGAMADSADLIVLGAWYGSGKKGGMMSVFLMGCYDPKNRKFCTVTKVHTGIDDKTLDKLQNELDMVKISQDASKVPKWLNCTKTMCPDFVANDPKRQPVWEITGAEFTQHDVHTADGISIRFPRVTKMREDKDWETATNLSELQRLYKTSKEHTDVSLLMRGLDSSQSQSQKVEEEEEEEAVPAKKRRKNDGEERRDSPPEGKKDKERKRRKKAAKETSEDAKDKVETSLNSSEETVVGDVEIKDPIPDYFKGVKAIIEEDLRKEEKGGDAVRNFIAYGGTDLPSGRWPEATHVLHYFNVIAAPVIECPVTARHLSIEWVKDSIAQGSLQDTRPYTVQWDPEILNESC